MDKIDELLTRAVENIYPSREALEKVLRRGKKLTLYQGFDPSGIQLHIGHLTGLMKLKAWQDLGHQVIFLIGDGTGQAGDPSGKSRTRDKFLNLDELRQNSKDYVLQAGKVINFHGSNPVKILYNSDWLNELKLVDILNIAQNFSLQQLEERDMFVERKKKGETINMREFMYPLLQGYDSVAMKVDLELGGSDQTFNMLCGRTLVKSYLHKEKFVMTTPLITDSQGKKIGKTEGNVIALTSPPNDFYGMVMNLPDEVLVKCFECTTDLPLEEVQKIKKALEEGENPMIYKKFLAFTLTRMLNDEKKAKEAKEHFEKTVQEGEIPSDIPEKVISLPAQAGNQQLVIVKILVESGLTNSNAEAKRLVEQGGVELNGQKITDPNQTIKVNSGDILKAGKRKYIKLIIQ